MAYLTAEQAAQRLYDRYNINAELVQADVDIASYALDDMGPFVGNKYVDDGTQVEAFPRTTTVVGDTEGVAPERVLDWVALKAYELATNEAPPVKSESAGRVSVTYELPKVSQNQKRMYRLIAPYFKTIGDRL